MKFYPIPLPIACIAMLVAPSANADDLIVVAHRGVVTDDIVENSIASLEATIARGYTHIEADLRCTKDGVPVVLHDENLKRTTGVDAKIGDLTLDELYAKVSKELVPTFEAFGAVCAGRIGVMPDVKGCPPELEQQYAAGIDAVMQKHGLYADALFIGRSAINLEYFLGKGKVSLREPLEDVRKLAAENPQLADERFIFGHAKDFDQRSVDGFHDLGLHVVVSINIFHYLRGNSVKMGLADVEKMKALGVDGLQIDSVYDEAVFGAKE